MTRQRRNSPELDIDALSTEVSVALEAAIGGASITLSRSGLPIGTLEFCSNVLEGTVINSPAQHDSTASTPDGVTVIATAMRLSATARRRLSDEFGSDYIVLDFHEAPTSTDVVLTNPVSPQLLGILRQQFPHARVVVTEIEDEELGVRYSGPVGRMLDAGAAAYLPPRPIAELAANVHSYLTEGGTQVLESGDPARPTLPTTPARQSESQTHESDFPSAAEHQIACLSILA
ncbi:hypothetical protein [Nocardioides sp. InS609-2]|uniref:hypothetical protein n=1 Tax=Nocardioides sp. InS609-2 TaxID=2760705 RepID=UPI0020BE11EE|nr:hypothetical protein [Nocardioides sp. InS609-2]